MNHRLIFVEGLTGSGKSTLAHFIARQLKANGIPVDWVHEGQDPHPILGDDEAGVDHFLAETRANWKVYFAAENEGVRVLEATYFNNLLETLWTHNFEPLAIHKITAELYDSIAPLNPALVYLTQADVGAALTLNFKRRGPGFKDFVIAYTDASPLAQANGWQGEDGMLQFWEAFVGLTDQAYCRFPGEKVKIDISTGDWETCNRQAMAFLNLPLIPEASLSPSEAKRYTGVYQEADGSKKFVVSYDGSDLWFGFGSFFNPKMIPTEPDCFELAGWPFEVCFEIGLDGHGWGFRIGGKVVDYMPLFGVVAESVSTIRAS